MTDKYLNIAQHYDSCLKMHGDSHKGVDWPNENDLRKRFKVMYGVTQYQTPKDRKIDLLDFGCGFGLFLEFLRDHGVTDKINYSGIDILQSMIDLAKKKWPQENFLVQDVLKNNLSDGAYDYVVMNGVFTEKVNLGQDEMIKFFTALVRAVFKSCRIGIAFNVMSHHVDWKRDDLFHLPFDQLADFLTKEFGRNYLIRSDYGLYEYTVYLFKSANE